MTKNKWCGYLIARMWGFWSAASCFCFRRSTVGVTRDPGPVRSYLPIGPIFRRCGSACEQSQSQAVSCSQLVLLQRVESIKPILRVVQDRAAACYAFQDDLVGGFVRLARLRYQEEFNRLNCPRRQAAAEYGTEAERNMDSL